ncbi:MAG: DUF2169 domain-containing protein [Betaproteobacteria bacterium]|nr:DUF2169 domain-containing protein [Betaproteobacteria bacterium]
MEWTIPARFLFDAFTAYDVSGYEHLVTIVKATWQIPTGDHPPYPIIPPPPFCIADEFHGEAGLSPMRYGSDYFRFKSRCDVLFDSVAHAPDGKPVPRLDVSVQVGNWRKKLRVHGDRKWQHGLVGLTPGEAEPFVSIPLHFGRAFGGSREYGNDKRCESLLSNPSGIGWGGPHTWHKLKGEPVPNLEYPNDPILDPQGGHRPAALSAVPGHWDPRRRYTGTYDDAWRRDRSPLLPDDFDERFYQSAPEDQQLSYPHGGEQVVLRNLLARAEEVSFKLPPLAGIKLHVTRNDDSVQTLDAYPDTLFFETESNRFSVIWRASALLRRNLIEVDEIELDAPDELLEVAA